MLKPIEQIKDRLKIIESWIKLNRHRIKKFRPKVSFRVEKGDYCVKTAESPVELEACLRLRYQVFMSELLKKSSGEGVDVDKMDIRCDHIMIIHKDTNDVVGTYRVASSIHTDQFYSQGEFDLSDLLNRKGNKLELGRACISKEHRSGQVMQLLWRGVSAYFKATSAQYLFGCTSVKTMEPQITAQMCAYFKEKDWVADSYNITPTKKFLFKELSPFLDSEIESTKEAKALVPPLFVSYIRAGAKACVPPAIDKDFRCVDFLTILNLEELSPAHARKFIGDA